MKHQESIHFSNIWRLLATLANWSFSGAFELQNFKRNLKELKRLRWFFLWKNGICGYGRFSTCSPVGDNLLRQFSNNFCYSSLQKAFWQNESGEIKTKQKKHSQNMGCFSSCLVYDKSQAWVILNEVRCCFQKKWQHGARNTKTH